MKRTCEQIFVPNALNLVFPDKIPTDINARNATQPTAIVGTKKPMQQHTDFAKYSSSKASRLKAALRTRSTQDSSIAQKFTETKKSMSV